MSMFDGVAFAGAAEASMFDFIPRSTCNYNLQHEDQYI